MKKTGAFLLILLCVLTCMITAMGDFVYTALFGDQSQAEGTQYALTLDENGIVHYIENIGGVNHIVKVDDVGNLIVDEQLPVLTDAQRFVVQSLYVTREKYIYVSGYEVDQVQRTASRALVVVLDENGLLCATPLDLIIPATPFRAAREDALFASMSENEQSVFFAYANQGQIATMVQDKSDFTRVSTLAHYKVPQGLSAMHINADGRVLASGEDGSVYLSQPQGEVLNKLNAPAVYTFRMYDHSNANTIYLWDAHTGGVRQFNYEKGELTNICAGEMVIDETYNFADFSQVAVGTRGKMAGMTYNAGYTIFTGSESRMVQSPSARRMLFDLDKLMVVAVLFGAFLVTVLLWDIYCNLLKMRVSVLIRQALLISMTLVILCYVLLNVILLPQMEKVMYQQYEHQVSTASEVMAAGIAHLEEEARTDIVHNADVRVQTADENKLSVYFSLVRSGVVNTLLTTNELSVTSVAYNTLPLSADLTHAIDTAIANGWAMERRHDALGDNIYALTRVGADSVVIAGMNASTVGASLTALAMQLRFFLLSTCAMLFFALLFVESLTVRSIYRLRRGVDAVSAGNYDVNIDVSSGDEVENLAHAFMSMAHKIKDNTCRLTQVSDSYYRFVPQNLVSLLGETSIEKVGKSSCVESTMTVLTLHFTFNDKQVLSSTKELFRNVNNVIEHLSPVVTEQGGTVYDFNADGFIAVFERNQDALRAALRMREVAGILEETHKGKGLRAVDVRVVLCAGDVMLGVIGDEKRMAPVVVSDLIARSQRIGALQVASNVYILCTREVVQNVQSYRMRAIGLYEDEGSPLELYDVYDGDPYALLKSKEELQPQFEEALSLFYAGDMIHARVLFMQIVKMAFDDGVSRNYLYCADTLKDNPATPYYRLM